MKHVCHQLANLGRDSLRRDLTPRGPHWPHCWTPLPSVLATGAPLWNAARWAATTAAAAAGAPNAPTTRPVSWNPAAWSLLRWRGCVWRSSGSLGDASGNVLVDPLIGGVERVIIAPGRLEELAHRALRPCADRARVAAIFPYRNGYAAYVRVTKPDGRRTRKYVYGKTREDVHDKWIRLHAQAKAGPVATKVPTLPEYLT
jgi:hypothetical protein